jgi:membrane associated rhomboid family serine protease
MSIYDRPYIRSAFVPEWSVLKCIFVVNIVVFILQAAFKAYSWLPESFMETTFGLSMFGIKRGYFWTLFSHGALHGGWMHLILNSVVIYVFGKSIQASIGAKELLKLYITAIFFGGLFWVFTHLFEYKGMVIGASGGALGLVTVFCLIHFYEKITFYLYFVLPISLKGKTMLLIVLGVNLFGYLFDELPLNKANGVAYSAHIGGILGGWIFFKFFLKRNRSTILSKRNWLEKLIKRFQSKQKSLKCKKTTGNFQVNINSHKYLREEADRILDKISEKGFQSLTDKEKQTLDYIQKIIKS